MANDKDAAPPQKHEPLKEVTPGSGIASEVPKLGSGSVKIQKPGILPPLKPQGNIKSGASSSVEHTVRFTNKLKPVAPPTGYRLNKDGPITNSDDNNKPGSHRPGG